MDYKIGVIVVFTLSYIGIILFTRKKTFFAGGGAFLLCLLHFFLKGPGPGRTLGFILHAVNWNVLGIFLGTLLIAEAFILSKVPALIAHGLVGSAKNTGGAVLLICIMTSILSAFVENVATVLIIAPIALEVADRQEVSPVPFLIGIAISSNLQGTATLIGDPPSMILAGYMRMNFNDFFFMEGRPGIFFAVQIGALLSFIVLYFFYRSLTSSVVPGTRPSVESWFPTGVILCMILLLAVSSLIDPDFSYFGGAICMALGTVCGVRTWLKERFGFRELTRRLDLDTIGFLASVFILVASLQEAGIMGDIAAGVGAVLGSNVFVIYTFFVWFSVLISAFVDNVPYITAMIPVAKLIALNLSIPPYLFVFGILIGACLGGNVTHVGASANVVAVSILKKRGYHIGLREFGRMGLPFTLAATAGSYIFAWIFWS